MRPIRLPELDSAVNYLRARIPAFSRRLDAVCRHLDIKIQLGHHEKGLPDAHAVADVLNKLLERLYDHYHQARLIVSQDGLTVEVMRLPSGAVSARFIFALADGFILRGLKIDEMYNDSTAAPLDLIHDANLIHLNDQEIRLIENGKRIEAIKHLRDRTGCGLREAYDATLAAIPMT